MDGPVYPRAFAARGIAAELPGADDRRIINEIIFAELVNGVFTESSRREYVRIIEELAARGCDAVALVCTEIPLLVTPEVAALPVLDSTRLLARAAFDVAVGRHPCRPGAAGPFRADAAGCRSTQIRPGEAVGDAAAGSHVEGHRLAGQQRDELRLDNGVGHGDLRRADTRHAQAATARTVTRTPPALLRHLHLRVVAPAGERRDRRRANG